MDKIPYKGNLVISLEYDSFEILSHNLIIGILNKYVYLINLRKIFEIRKYDFHRFRCVTGLPRNKTPSKWYQSESDSRPFKMIGFILIIFS